MAKALPVCLFFLAAVGLAAGAVAQTPAAAGDARAERPNPEGPLQDLGLLHRGAAGDTVNELWLLGRYHGQPWWADGEDDSDHDYETRRFRYGTQMRLFDNLTIHAQAISGSDFEPTYNGFTELWVSWRFSDEINLTVGQQKHRFTHDRNVSSRYMNYLERSQVTNMFGADYTPAVTLSGRVGDVSYYTGLFSNATGQDMEKAFFELNSGHSFLGAVTVDLGKSLGADRTFWTSSVLSSDANANATNLNVFSEGLATALVQTRGPASLMTEVTAGLGARRGDVLGLNLQPGVFLTDRLQLVARYQLAGSEAEDGLRAQRRYEREVGLSRGDLYQAGYVGLNFYVFGHRLKLMSGLEYAALDGEEVWTASLAFRTFWGPHSRGPFPMGDLLPGL